MEFYEQEGNELLRQFGSDTNQGLADSQVEQLRTQHGKNILTEEHSTPWYKMLLGQFTGMLIYILLAAGVVTGLLGEWIDTIVILAILLINGIFGFVQEYKAQASIQALKKMASAKATVIRNGQPVSINAEDLVPGDILVLQTGDKIPADARVIEQTLLETQEGALTGESTTVNKTTDTLHGELALGDQKNMVFSGTIITKGHGKAIIVATGMKTQIGKIAHMIQQSEVEDTPLQKNLEKFGSRLGKLTVGICLLIFVFIALVTADSFSIIALKDAFLLSVTLAVAAIPEGLPIVVTIALAFGTRRMVKRHGLIKRLSSVETLGSTTVICSDKTGTLTKNEMTVTTVWHAGKIFRVNGIGYAPNGVIDGELPRIAYEICALCNDAELKQEEHDWTVIGDPTEGCLVTLARKGGFDEQHLRPQHPRIGEIPFSSERKCMSTINEFDHAPLLLTKGAPDVILEHCTHILDRNGKRELTQHDKEVILAQNENFAKDALRVLGFAFKETQRKSTYTEEDEWDLTFVALTGMIDPARSEAKDAIARCKEAGIRVVMITGDHKTTAVAIARELGIEGDAIEGGDIDDIHLDDEVERIGIYARVNPEHKMAIVDALKRKGHIVAMTGDGVNDAPALKRSDIGIAMGITGTDVAKESASMILTDDNFASIVNAVEEGRNIYTNIKKFVNYLLSSNFAEVLVIFFGVLIFTRDGHVIEPLIPVMILYMNLVTDSLPALALGVDPGNPLVMKHKPRDPNEHIVNKNMMSNIILIGVVVTAATLFAFWYGLKTGEAHAQTMALTTLVVLEIVRLAMIRKQYNTPFFSNKWLVLAIASVLVLQVLVVYTPWAQFIFRTVPLLMTDWLLIIAIAATTYIVGMLGGEIVRKVTHQHD